MQADQPHPAEHAADSIISPFSDAESHSFKQRKGNAALWVSLALTFVIVLTIGGFFLFRYLNDPFRTLQPFPVAKYMDGYKALAGSKFRAILRVENDLGWKEGVGRLMAFTIRDEPHPIVVMIPPSLAQIYFVKGQSYRAELEVKEGGLIYANSCKKD